MEPAVPARRSGDTKSCSSSRWPIPTTSPARASDAGAKFESVLLIDGESADGYGARCGRCHAFLFAAVRGKRYMHVSLGMLADTPTLVPNHHIFVGSKAPWHQITDSLPQFETLP